MSTMSQKRRAPRKPKVLIIYDSSTLYTESSHIITKLFDQVLEFKNKLIIETHLPEIVIREIKARCLKSASEKLQKLESARNYINELSGTMLVKACNASTVKSTIKKTVDKWVKRHGITIIALPTAIKRLSIDAICSVAVSKDSVFREGKSDGFKDYLILCSIKKHIESSKYARKIFFVSHDKILCEEVEKELSEKSNFEVLYTQGDELLEKLTILADKLDEEHTALVKKEAAELFYTSGNRNSFYFAKVRDAISSKFSLELKNPTVGVTEGIIGGILGPVKEYDWFPVDSGKAFIGELTLVSSKSKVYEYQTNIAYRRAFEKEISSTPSTLGGLFAESAKSHESSFGDELLGSDFTTELAITPKSTRLIRHDMEINFQVHWKANNRKGVKLENPQVINIELISKNMPPL